MKELSICDSFSPFAIIETDERRFLADWNVAAGCLFGSLLLARPGQPVSALIEKLTGGAMPCATRTSSLTSIQDWKVDIKLAKWGRACGKLSLVEETGGVAKLFMRLDHVEDAADFESRYRSEVERELVWETYATSYDRVLLKLPFYNQVVDRHKNALLGHGAKSILDIGAGTGNLAFELAEAGCKITAVDNSRGMLRRFCAKLDRTSPDLRPVILRQDAESLAVAGHGPFDGVNVLLALFAMRDPELALERSVQCLRRGGVMVVTEPRRSFDMRDLLGRAESALRDAGLLESLRGDWDRVFAVNERIDPSRRQPFPVEVIADELECMGLRVLRMEDSHFGNCATLVAEKSNVR